MEFINIKRLLQAKFTELITNQRYLFITEIERETLWETYVNSFPIQTKQEYNCNSCRQFIKPFGNVVAILDNKITTFWDFECGDSEWQNILNNMRDLVLNSHIKDVFVTKINKLGVDSNLQLLENKTTVRWQHFYYQLPKIFVSNSIDSEESIKADYRDAKNVFKRALDELTPNAIDTVLDLIAQNSLYRGNEYKGLIETFKVTQQEYLQLKLSKRDIYCWQKSLNVGASLSKIRNSAIGTLLIDISNDVDLDLAVRKWEHVMAPTNYKRPKAIITQKMIKEAEETIKGLGLLDSLERRFALQEDIRLNNVIYVDRTKKQTGVFAQLKETITINPKQLTQVTEISLQEFLEKVVPTSFSIELLLENKHESNLVSLIAPIVPNSESLFKWTNGFSWCYNNNLTDSTKELVKKHGGKIDGVLRFSIRWNEDGKNNIDFDAHCIEPNSNHIYYSRKMGHNSTGELDVDIIDPKNEIAVENITWSNINKMQLGIYHFFLKNYSGSSSKGGFSAEIEYNGQIYSFDYPHILRGYEEVTVAKFNFTKGNELNFIESLKSSLATKELWNLPTNKFHKVINIMNSPNHWDGVGIGNKHTFLFLEGCKNNDTRGFFNEFLRQDLDIHKRVFEALGGRMSVATSDKQLSGVGFSETLKNDFTVKITGTFDRILKVNVG